MKRSWIDRRKPQCATPVRQRRANFFDLRVDFIGDIDGIAFRLTMDAEQDGRFAIAVTMV